MARLRLTIPLFLVYLALTSNLAGNNLLVGLLVGAGLSWVLRPLPRPFSWRRLPTALLAVARYLLVLLFDLITSGVQVARIVLDPKLPIRPGVVAIPAGCESELATALSAHAISLTPGELVVEIDEDGVMYTHCLDATRAADYVTEAQQMRRDLLQKIFA
jgi:multicomponent Na+:H+ antiporter subunit E